MLVVIFTVIVMQFSTKIHYTILGILYLNAAVASADEDVLVGRKSVFERQREEYKFQPARIRNFEFRPVIAVTEEYDSNIYAAPNAEKDDFITKIQPQASLESDWGKHALKVEASGDVGRYLDNVAENYNDYTMKASGRLDVLKETFVTGEISYIKSHDERSDPNANSSSAEPAENSKTSANISFVRSLRRLSLKVDGAYVDNKYQNSANIAGDTIINNDRNYRESTVKTRVGYEIIPGYQAFVKALVNRRDYVRRSISDATKRNSDGFELQVGTALDLGGKTRGEVSLGYMKQNYESNTLKNINGAQFGGNIIWNITPLTSINASILRDIKETTETGSSGYISTLYSADIEHELLYNLLIGTSFSYNISDYISTNVVARADEKFDVGTKIKYLLNRRASFSLQYDYSRRKSNLIDQDYIRNIIMVSLNIKL